MTKFADDHNDYCSDIHQVHSVLLELYAELRRICDKYGLLLFLTGGSALGAVRHRGFIPWDDDMDVALPRNDYERLALLAEQELPGHIKLVWIPRICQYKLIDTRYRVLLNENYRKLIDDNEQSCVAIDIQPLDGVPKGIKGKIHSIRVLSYRAFYKMCSPERIIYDEEWRKTWELLLIKTLALFSYFFKDENYWKTKFLSEMKKYSYESCEIIADYVGKYKFKDIYPKEWWEPGRLTEFENTTVLIPSNYDKYLSNIYGNYMALPEKSERVMHSYSD